jgi:phosphatidate cytidylyltransferase
MLRARILSAIVLAPVAVAAIYWSPWSLIAVVAVAGALGAWEWERMCAGAPAWRPVGWIVLAVAAAATVWLRADSGADAVMWVMGAVWATDIGAYAFGSWLGGPKIAPRVSPNKTWSGFAGGVACALAWTIVFARATGSTESTATLLAAGAAASVVAQLGDLAVSGAKRRFGVKDSSALIPGHGGVLDRIAGLLTTGPVLALLLLVMSNDPLAW